jgi:hypothetical protein
MGNCMTKQKQYKQSYYQCRGCGKAFFDGNGNKKEALCPTCRATKNTKICPCCKARFTHPSNYSLCWPCFVTNGNPDDYYHRGGQDFIKYEKRGYANADIRD